MIDGIDEETVSVPRFILKQSVILAGSLFGVGLGAGMLLFGKNDAIIRIGAIVTCGLGLASIVPITNLIGSCQKVKSASREA